MAPNALGPPFQNPKGGRGNQQYAPSPSPHTPVLHVTARPQVQELRSENVYLSTVLEEVGSLLWAASQQLERPYEAIERLLSAISIGAHACEEGRLNLEVCLGPSTCRLGGWGRPGQSWVWWVG